jgi:exonuclease III
MKIATYNVNGVNGRLPVLLRWLKEAKPDIVCLQELKAPNEKFRYRQLTMQVMLLNGMDKKAGMGLLFFHGLEKLMN